MISMSSAFLIDFEHFRQRSGAYEYNMTPDNRKFILFLVGRTFPSRKHEQYYK